MALAELEPILKSAIFDSRYRRHVDPRLREIYKDNPPRMQEPATKRLIEVSQVLAKRSLLLVVWDTYRPLEAQRILQELESNENYVLPDDVSNHPKGWAFDGTLAYKDGTLVDMGSDFDDFTERGHSNFKDLSPLQLANRGMFAEVMESHGFKQWPWEWWHFDYVGPEVQNP